MCWLLGIGSWVFGLDMHCINQTVVVFPMVLTRKSNRNASSALSRAKSAYNPLLVVSFGKYKGMKMSTLVEDRHYVEWLHRNPEVCRCLPCELPTEVVSLSDDDEDTWCCRNDDEECEFDSDYFEEEEKRRHQPAAIHRKRLFKGGKKNPVVEETVTPEPEPVVARPEPVVACPEPVVTSPESQVDVFAMQSVFLVKENVHTLALESNVRYAANLNMSVRFQVHDVDMRICVEPTYVDYHLGYYLLVKMYPVLRDDFMHLFRELNTLREQYQVRMQCETTHVTRVVVLVNEIQCVDPRFTKRMVEWYATSCGLTLIFFSEIDWVKLVL